MNRNLGAGDVLGLAVCWTGAAAVAYFTRDCIVGIVCVATAYYLAKWIIMKKVQGPKG